MSLSQQQKLSQQLVMTPQMLQAMKILQLSRLELEQYVKTQMAENPVLEEREYGPEEPLSKVEHSTEDVLLAQLKSLPESTSTDNKEVDWEILARHKEALMSHTSAMTSKAHASKTGDGVHPLEQVMSARVTLTDHLYDQIVLMTISAKQKLIAQEIIGNINEKGYLEPTIDELVVIINHHHTHIHPVNHADVAAVLELVQKCEPTGAGSRSLEECLRIQMREWNKENPYLIPMVKTQTKELQRKNYAQIAKNLGISLAEVDATVALLTELEPIPGRAFLQPPSPYITVDVSVIKVGNQWQVVPHDDNLNQVTLSSHYLELMKSMAQGKQPGATYLQEKVRSAQWLLKAIWKRQSTILKVSQVIVAKQLDFFEKGPQYLTPMTLKDVAEMIDIHESTVSRVTAGKYMQTPRGIFELRYFFSSAISSQRGSDVIASESVRKIIADLIARENPKTPLSDQKIVDILTIRGITLARRTVAKYREQLAIPSSSRRRRFA